MSDPIPSSRRTDWTPGTYTGVPGGIPTDRTNVINVTLSPYFADNTGATDASAAIQSAWDASSEEDIIYLPTGTYKLTSTLNLGFNKNNRTIRGDGPTLTILAPNGNVQAFSAGSSGSYSWSNVASGMTLGSTSITVADGTLFSGGNLMRISYQNQNDNTAISSGSVPVVALKGYDIFTNEAPRLQTVRVVSVASNTVTISPGLYAALESGLIAKAIAFTLIESGVGLEEFAIDMTNSTATSAIQWESVYGFWMENVKIHDFISFGILVENCLQCEIRHCEITTRRNYSNLSPGGAGMIMNSCSGFLFEDNIVHNVFPNIEINSGSCGNAFTYNVFENDAVTGSVPFSIDTNHNPHNSYNVYEGNITPNIVADGYFGSVSDDTFHRNWIHGACISNDGTTFTCALKRLTREYSFAGNVIGKNGVAEGGFSLGQPNIGNGDSFGTASPLANDFWADWKATGTISTRTSNTAGTLTLISGSFIYHNFDGNYAMVVRWNSAASYQQFTASTGSASSISWTGGSGDNLPAQDSTVDVWFGNNGFQELDEDVEGTLINKGNYTYGTGGAAGSMSSLGGDTLATSYIYGSTPSWWTDENPGLAWPPFDPTSPNSASYANTPSGIRFSGSVPPPPGGVTFSGPGSTTFSGAGTVTFA